MNKAGTDERRRGASTWFLRKVRKRGDADEGERERKETGRQVGS